MMSTKAELEARVEELEHRLAELLLATEPLLGRPGLRTLTGGQYRDLLVTREKAEGALHG